LAIEGITTIAGVKFLEPYLFRDFALATQVTVATQKGVANADVHEVLPGELLGKITASGKYQQRPVTKLAAPVAQGAAVVKVATGEVPTAFRVGVAIAITEGAHTEDLGAIVVIDWTLDPVEIRVTNGIAKVGGYTAAAILHLTALDGSENAVGILGHTIDLAEKDEVVKLFVKGVFKTTDLLRCYSNGTTSFIWSSGFPAKQVVEDFTIL